MKIKKISNLEYEIEVELSSQELDSYIDKAIEKAGKNLEIQGFRKGKAPKNIVEEKIGKENILIEAADMAVKDSYPRAVLESRLEVISEPKIEILKLAPKNPFVFKAKISVLPEIDLPDYKKIAKKIEKKEVSVEDKEIDNALIWLQRSRAKFTLKNQQAQKGDFIDIEYWSSSIPKPLKDSFIIGEGHFIPGFEEKLIGLESGKETEFSLDIPENHSFKKIAGKNVDFKVKVNSVQKVELSEINDDFAKGLGNYDNLEALKKSIKEGLLIEKQEAQIQRVRSEILEKIGNSAKFEVPQSLISREQNTLMENLKKEISGKIDFNDYLEKIKKTEKELSDSFKEEAIKRIRAFLILREIGKKENIEVSEEEVREKVNNILKYYPSPKEAQKDIDFNRLKDYSREVIRNEKIFKLLKDSIQK